MMLNIRRIPFSKLSFSFNCDEISNLKFLVREIFVKKKKQVLKSNSCVSKILMVTKNVKGQNLYSIKYPLYNFCFLI